MHYKDEIRAQYVNKYSIFFQLVMLQQSKNICLPRRRVSSTKSCFWEKQDYDVTGYHLMSLHFVSIGTHVYDYSTLRLLMSYSLET